MLMFKEDHEEFLIPKEREIGTKNYNSENDLKNFSKARRGAEFKKTEQPPEERQDRRRLTKLNTSFFIAHNDTAMN